jgi:hypothetical protein
MNKRQTVISIGVSVFIFMVLSVIYIILSMRGQITDSKNHQTTITSAPVNRTGSTIQNQPLSVKALPTLPASLGRGIDTNSKIVKKSENEIRKIYAFLPYNQNQFINGVQVSIIIPDQAEQDNPWTLYVQIFGINYNSKKGDPDYETMKNTFRESAQYVTDWLEQHEVSTQEVVIQWGDKKFIEDKAEEWLTEI